MLASKMTVLRPLIESNQGQHLTAYLVESQNIFQLKRQLRETLETAYEYLAPVMSPEALTRFLAPIHNALDDSQLLKKLKGNLGVFRNENSFRILSLPVPVEQTCVVATSFHVKPLLRWIQTDREFLLLGVTDNSASLYQGNQSSFELVAKAVFPAFMKKHSHGREPIGPQKKQLKDLQLNAPAEWFNDWLFKITKDSKPLLFVAGRNDLANAILEDIRYTKSKIRQSWPHFSESSEQDICSEIRALSKTMAQKDLEMALIEFYQAEDFNLAHKNIFQIAKAAVKGKVRKLIIADGINIFGKLDKKSGGLSIHPTHLDHEDDDILDDLAQEVLAHGGDVIVAAKEEIPKGRPILAILERSDSEMIHSPRATANPPQAYERTAL